MFPELFIVPDAGVAPREALSADAATWQAAMANCVVKLFKSGYNVTATTTQAELAAVVCDFDGYASATVVAMLDPVRQSDGSSVVLSPTTQFNYVDGATHVANDVGGFWVEDATGKLRLAANFADPITVGTNDDGVPVIFGRVFKS